MRTIYIDPDFKCHITDDGTRIPFDTDFFDGKCDAFVEGYLAVPQDHRWIRSDGMVFPGEMIAPWKDYDELDSAQRDYERQRLADAENALAILLGGDTV